jgi:general stress protein YciG
MRNQDGGSRGRGSRGGGRERGFAAMDAAKQREIARKGGQASARSQVRDEQGQFGGKREGGARSGGAQTGRSGGSR